MPQDNVANIEVEHLDFLARRPFNLEILQKAFPEDSAAVILQKVGDALEVNFFDVGQIDEMSVGQQYSVYLAYLLQQLLQHVQFDSDDLPELVSVRELTGTMRLVCEFAYSALQLKVHPRLRNVMRVPATLAAADSAVTHAEMEVWLKLTERILHVQAFKLNQCMNGVLRCYVACCYSVHLGKMLQKCPVKNVCGKNLKQVGDYCWENLDRKEYFRTLLILKSAARLPQMLHEELLRELHRRLCSQQGFYTLAYNLLSASAPGAASAAQVNEKNIIESIAKIVAQPNSSAEFQLSMVKQILQLIDVLSGERYVERSALDNYILSAGLFCLNRLYALGNKEALEKWLVGLLAPLRDPIDILAGLVVLSAEDFEALFKKLYECFCLSWYECLPSVLLAPHLVLLLQLVAGLPNTAAAKHHVVALATRCLSNRPLAELLPLVNQIYNEHSESLQSTLHERIRFSPTCGNEAHVQVLISSVAEPHQLAAYTALPQLFAHGQQNLLLYQLFKTMFYGLIKEVFIYESLNLDLVTTQEEVTLLLDKKFGTPCKQLTTLMAFTAMPELQAQIVENIADFMQLLQVTLQAYERVTEQVRTIADNVMLIICALAVEIVEHSDWRQTCKFDKLLPLLQTQAQKCANPVLKGRFEVLLQLIKEEKSSTLDGCPFRMARTMLEGPQPHDIVCGIETFLKLLEDKDEYTKANGDVLLALTMQTLKNKDSYVFLNCVRLLRGLMNIAEKEVIEALVGEYMNEHAAQDYRLVVGEAIVKISQELGPLLYKYKGELFNCFLVGARDHNDEFRWSSYSNLSQMCRILSYQVQGFFQELLSLVQYEITKGSYLPAKRSAVMVASQLLKGMDNLQDFEEMLLPLYTLLKNIVLDSKQDDVMREHAEQGLAYLQTKCKQLLFPEQKLTKEIKILNIKDDLSSDSAEGKKKKKPGLIIQLN